MNGKIIFTQVSEHCGSFGRKNPILSLFRGGSGRGDLHIIE